jgi:hypothetical protein
MDARGCWRALAAPLGLVLLALAPAAASAAVFDVDTIADDATLTACTGAGADCSLRGAIIAANASAGPHTINLPVGTYTLTITGQNEEAALTGDLDILSDITIVGAVTRTTIVQWDALALPANRDRVFQLIGAGGARLTLRDLTIRNGAGAVSGGGILSSGELLLERVHVHSNAVTTTGGGLLLGDTATIRQSTINNNNATTGGGIFQNSTSVVTIENSTLSGNSATGNAGGLEGPNGVGSSTLSNVTVTGNSAGLQGGGIRVNAGQVFVRNSIVSGNLAVGGGPNCQGNTSSQGYNLVFGGGTCGFAGATNDLVGSNPQLGPLADTGGPTPNHPLGSDSEATDKGNPAQPGSGGNVCLATDQRGLQRNVDGVVDELLDGVPRCDIGAVEGGRWLNVDTVTDSNAAGFQVCSLLPNDCSLRGAISRANSLAGAYVVTLGAQSYRLTEANVGGDEDVNATGDLDVSQDVTVVGATAHQTTIEAGASPETGIDRVFEVLSNGGVGRLVLQGVTVQHGNPAADGGGGVDADGGLGLSNTHIRANRGTTGAGVRVRGDGAILSNSALTGNVGTSSGGGIAITTAADAAILSNVTVHGNNATTGGGVDQQGAGPTVQLNNVTIAGNHASIQGGGIGNADGTFDVRNSIVSGNTDSLGSPNCFENPTSQDNNLVFGGGTCGFNMGSDIQNQNPLLGALQLNGGTVPSLMPALGSAALDKGNPLMPGSPGNSCVAADQRGVARPKEGDATGSPLCDIGAVELDPCNPRFPVQVSVVPNGVGGLTVSVTPGFGAMTQLHFHGAASGQVPSPNALVDIGALVGQSGDFIFNNPTGMPLQFTLRRAVNSGSATMPFDVTDGCGVWPTFAGGGESAWIGAGGGAPSANLLPVASPAAAPRSSTATPRPAASTPTPTLSAPLVPGAACARFPSHAAAQAHLRANPTDPLLLDRSRNGIACEGADGAGFVNPPLDHVPVPRP